MKQLCFESANCPNTLTDVEIKARDNIVNFFNPALKLLLANANLQEFKRYGYNSCRQSAILGAVYLKELLPDYEIIPYEGNFIEKETDGSIVPYVHCFIIASKDNRMLLIDFARTEKRILFNEIHTFGYPAEEEYKNVFLLSKEVIDLDELYYNTDITEYFTKLNPKDVMRKLKSDIIGLEEMQPFAQRHCRDIIYRKFTTLLD